MSRDKTLAISIATYAQGEFVLPSLIYGLLSQTSDAFHAYITHDGPSIDNTKVFMEGIVGKYPDLFSYHETARRRNQWGHEGRALTLANCKEPYITFTNGDNIYCKDYVKSVLYYLNAHKGLDVLTVGITHNYFNYTPFPGNDFAICKTDFMNFVVCTDKARQVGLVIDQFACDGIFCEQMKTKFPALFKVHLPAYLGIHQ